MVHNKVKAILLVTILTATLQSWASLQITPADQARIKTETLTREQEELKLKEEAAALKSKEEELVKHQQQEELKLDQELSKEEAEERKQREILKFKGEAVRKQEEETLKRQHKEEAKAAAPKKQEKTQALVSASPAVQTTDLETGLKSLKTALDGLHTVLIKK